MRIFLILLFCVLGTSRAEGQVDESATGAWYMYFYNFSFDESQWGMQGDFQYRDWQGLSDMEQLLLRSGVTWSPKESNLLFTFGFANITSGVPGPSSATSYENRIYQEALIPWKVGSRFYFSHRLRYEQRFVEGQDFRTRFRYNLFLNIPLNSDKLEAGTTYVALYNEIFLNGQQDIGNGRTAATFDRNRAYAGIGHILSPRTKLQIGWMYQSTELWDKGQLQFSLHNSF